MEVATLEAIASALEVPVTVFFEEQDRATESSIVGSNIITGNAVMGSNSINISLPEKGYQKIIKSDGTQVTIESRSPAGENAGLLSEIERLKRENDSLKDQVILLQKKIIESL